MDTIHLKHIASHISHIRYDDERPLVHFNFKGNEQTIEEPKGTLLRDDLRSAIWIAQHYDDMLSKMDDVMNLGG